MASEMVMQDGIGAMLILRPYCLDRRGEAAARSVLGFCTDVTHAPLMPYRGANLSGSYFFECVFVFTAFHH